MGCCAIVPEAHIGVVERFGKFDRTEHPGCVCLIPCVTDVTGMVPLNVRQLNVRVETKTSDNVFIIMEVSVQYEAIPDKAYDAFYRLTSPAGQINSFVYDVVRSSAPTMALDEVFEEKQKIAVDIKNQLIDAMTEFGFRILDALVVDIEPDYTVKEAMNEQNASRRMRIAAQEKAEAEKIMLVKNAEAEAESKFLAGQGIARQRQAIIEGLKTSVESFTESTQGISSKDVMELLLITQHFDTVKDLASTSKSQTIFIPHNPGAVGEIAEEIMSSLKAPKE
ncbi:HIR complex subunit [Perkinsus olseni]|uniref:HIR complex subunit n=2 Tax=Perkinsus olseni TaxID=32597 RepID=A0A7J6UCL2_PEROL|nr:HIR complex subunit [Perkinsus olseni]